eukprot:332145_1
MSTASTVLGIMCMTISWSFGWTLVYYAKLFFKLRHDQLIVKRRGQIVLCGNICGIMLLLFGFPLTIYLYWDWHWEYRIDPNSALFIFFDILNDILFTPFYTIAVMMILLRYWMIYYDIHLAKSALNKKWKQIINASALQEEEWWIVNINTYGNLLYMMKRSIIIAIIWIIIFFISSLIVSPFKLTTFPAYSYVFILFSLTSVILIVIIWKRIPYFNDNIYLYREIKIILYLWFSSLGAYAIAIIIETFTGPNLFTLTFQYLASISGMFSINFLSTFWVIQHLQIKEDDHEYSISRTVDQQMRQLSDVVGVSKLNKQKTKRLFDILSDNDLFDLFMQHLIREFSHEILLAFVELVQYKSHLIEKFGINVNDIDIDVGRDIGRYQLNFCETLKVKSSIVYENENVNDENVDLYKSFKIKAYKIYKKYICTGSENEINIPYARREILKSLIANYDIWMECEFDEIQLAKIFDDEIKEMAKLMRYSKARFRYESLYRE